MDWDQACKTFEEVFRALDRWEEVSEPLLKLNLEEFNINVKTDEHALKLLIICIQDLIPMESIMDNDEMMI